MPYVADSEGLNLRVAELSEIIREQGDGSWRRAIVASGSCRAVLLNLQPGREPHPPHRHPRADEVFIILQGIAAFTIGSEPEFFTGPMTIVHAPPNVRHRVRAPGPEPLLFIAIVAPNLDVIDEALEDVADPRP